MLLSGGGGYFGGGGAGGSGGGMSPSTPGRAILFGRGIFTTLALAAIDLAQEGLAEIFPTNRRPPGRMMRQMTSNRTILCRSVSVFPSSATTVHRRPSKAIAVIRTTIRIIYIYGRCNLGGSGVIYSCSYDSSDICSRNWHKHTRHPIAEMMTDIYLSHRILLQSTQHEQ